MKTRFDFMRCTTFKTLAFTALLAPVVYGKNNWAKPCTSGTCSYEGGDGVNKAYSAMTIVCSCARITASQLTLYPRAVEKHPSETSHPPLAGLLWAVAPTGITVTYVRVSTGLVAQFILSTSPRPTSGPHGVCRHQGRTGCMRTSAQRWRREHCGPPA